jgi:hypothetical protein
MCRGEARLTLTNVRKGYKAESVATPPGLCQTDECNLFHAACQHIKAATIGGEFKDQMFAEIHACGDTAEFLPGRITTPDE